MVTKSVCVCESCESLTFAVVRWHCCHQVWRNEAMSVRQRQKVDCVAGGILKHHLQDLHRRQLLIGRQDHCCYTYTCTCSSGNGRLLQLHTQCIVISSSSCVCDTSSMCSSLGGSTTGGKTGAAITTRTNDVITRCEQINTAAKVGATGSL